MFDVLYVSIECMHNCAFSCCNHCPLFFTLVELQKANATYQEKLTAGRTAEQTMFNLSWDIEELNKVNSDCRKVFNELGCCINCCTDELFQSHNVPSKLTNVRMELCEVVKRIAHFRRNPATHVFVMMVSSETREKKPYSLPVQCIPYAGLKETELRRLINDLCSKMSALGLKVSGKNDTVTNIFFTIFIFYYRICQ